MHLSSYENRIAYLIPKRRNYEKVSIINKNFDFILKAEKIYYD